MAEKMGSRIPKKKTNNLLLSDQMVDELLQFPHLSGKELWIQYFDLCFYL